MRVTFYNHILIISQDSIFRYGEQIRDFGLKNNSNITNLLEDLVNEFQNPY